MDERILKNSVQSIEMPEEMKDRIIRNCKSGEAKPLILPKKRFPIGTAAAACVCVLAVALSGVGIWQAGDRGSDISLMPNENGADGADGNELGATLVMTHPYVEDISDDVINIIPLTNEDVEAARDVADLKWDDYKLYSDEQLADYYGIDLTALSGIFPGVMLHWGPENPDGKGVYSTDNGIYFDRNTYLYTDESTGDKSFQITASRFKKDVFTEKLWSDEEMLSRIDGTTVAIGGRQYMTVYEAEFSTSAGTYFHITAVSSIDELRTFITTIIEKTEQYLNGIPLTLDKLLEICSGDCSKLTWSDFEKYQATDIGSGLYVYQYDIEGIYTLHIGGVPEEEPFYMIFSLTGADDGIDIREESIEDYLAAHANNSAAVPLTLEKLKEVISSSAKLGWSDFEQFACTETGASYIIRRYDIEGFYYLLVGGDPDKDPPEYIYFSIIGTGQSERIDIRHNDIDSYIEAYRSKVNEIRENADLKAKAYEYIEISEQGYNGLYKKYHELLNKIDVTEQEIEAFEAELNAKTTEYGINGWDSTKKEAEQLEKKIEEKKNELKSFEEQAQELDSKLAAAETAVLDARQAFAATGARALAQIPQGPTQETIQMAPLLFAASTTTYWADVSGALNPAPDRTVPTADFVEMTPEELNSYYGVNVIPELPKYMTIQIDSGKLGLYRRNGGTGETYIDLNAYQYISNEHYQIYHNGGYSRQTMTVEVMKGAIPESCEDLWEYPDLLSCINGTTVAMGKISDFGFVAEFFVGDVGFHIVAYHITLDQLTDVISSLTAQ